ncbi:hypothetical protein [Halobiforma nitratireducens]|uniref:UspA domain-containing protein n=1 Tax=Halobiforma nitratireducens JCM 10879 TaxID=1227454 RepID=M0M283_9EURY|nr:hypothetical protein [Halobiforma nitratireducens]EMA38709.1 UspA domain-containing protein [Halobiforma nitratireducens JCM 10879]
MHYLAGTDSVHATAAICDYLEAQVGSKAATETDSSSAVGDSAADSDDGDESDESDESTGNEEPTAITIVAAVPNDGSAGRPERDAREALNVARVRLVGVDVLETELFEGSLDAALRSATAAHEIDAVIVPERRSDAVPDVSGSVTAVSVSDDGPEE